ncbi:RBBP8 N-terminal-like protein isoform X2 [Kryptolebias marmoratus]|uniref:Retinoblastoma binding protein 8-like n=1 Tax=Kryptolebias marmoratus TaxID=37003 RepID=A0A3Q3B310_KRYMA|nr:RBBP8 N-terminal-like protein isoform X2 [Kryptolebias marmoratus]
MENFKDLLQKLQETHEREVEGWQAKVKELSNKKGCDSKRMEELFTRNQQMKEQQRLLTENIKTLENRLRAGLCDRCTVTQEVAKRKQQEYEASQIHSLQHISLLAGEMTNLKKENLRLKDEARKLRAALDKDHSDPSSISSSTEVKPVVSPDLSPSPGVVALLSPTGGGGVAIKPEAERQGEEAERSRHLRNRSSFEVFKPQPTSAVPPWRTEHGVPRPGDGSLEVFEQHPSIHVQPPRKNYSSSPEVKLSRPVVHAPIPCHPRPIRSGPVPVPWPPSESSDWVSAGTGPAAETSSRLHLPRFPNPAPPVPQAGGRRHGFVPPWQKPNSHQLPAKEPTVVFKLRRVPDYPGSDSKKKDSPPPPKPEKPAEEEPRESSDGPLDLSDRGKSKSNQTPGDYSPSRRSSNAGTQRSPDNGVTTPASSSSPSPSPSSSSSSFTAAARKQEPDPTADHSSEVKGQEQKEEVDVKTDQSNGKKVPVLTLSLRPAVVRLEALNPALQKQESMSLNEKSANEPESSSDQQDDESESGPDGTPRRKRKRASVETETDRDLDPGNVHQERRIKITVRAEERSPS